MPSPLPFPQPPVQQTPSAPAAPRVPGLDVARALAILGMVIVNFQLVIASAATEPAWLRVAVTSIQGRAAATFVVLAGVGASLMARGARASGDPDMRRRVRSALVRRALFLGVLGTAFLVIWPADILHFYGAWMLVGAGLLFVSSPVIAGVALAVVAASATYLLVGDFFAHWNLATLEYEGLFRPARFLENLVLNGFHPVLPWLALYLGGMLLGRLDLTSASVRRRLLWTATPLAVVSHLAEDLLVPEMLDAIRPIHLLGTGSIPPTPGFVVACGSVAVLVIVLAIEVAPRMPRWIRQPLESTGQLALSIYIAHVVVGLGALEEMGRLEGQTLGYAVGASLLFTGLSVVCATLWRLRMKRGPVEALMRAIG